MICNISHLTCVYLLIFKFVSLQNHLHAIPPFAIGMSEEAEGEVNESEDTEILIRIHLKPIDKEPGNPFHL